MRALTPPAPLSRLPVPLPGRGGSVLAVLTVLCVLLVLGGCRGEAEKGGPIILISIDTLRSDRLPAYGYGKVETPAIDGLAKDAILFERAYSHYPLTLPSHVSILTGELPPVHKVRDNAGYVFESAKHPYLPRLLKAAGYETGAAVSAFVLRPDTGLADGFDAYDGDFESKEGQTLDSVQRFGGETLQVALPWIRERASKSSKPFFYFLHIYEPHSPYEAPEPFASRFPDPYDAEVAAADAVIGDLLAELKRLDVYDRATIVLLSDHGEGLGDHGESQHGIFLYREVIQVPLLVKLPGAKRGGERVAVPAQLADVAPTLLSLAGVEVPKGLPGMSLLDLGEKTPARRIYAESFFPRIHYGWSELASLVEDRFHYIEAPESELYDLAADPGEKRNVLAGERRTYSALREAMKAYDRRLTAPAEVDPETAAKLAALGYIGGSMADHEGPLPDPKGKRHILADVEKGFAANQAGRHGEAVALFERLLAESPRMQDVWAFYALSLQKLGRHEDSAKAYEKALELSGGSPQLALATGTKLLELGRFDEARTHAELALKTYPDKAYDLLSQIALKRGDTEEALVVMRRAVAEGKASEPLRRQMALTLSGRGQPAEAVALLQPLAAKGDPPTLNALAIALSDAGRHGEALAVLQTALQKDPKNAHAYETLGMVELRLQRPQQARDHLRQALALKDDLPIAWNTLGVALYQTEGPSAAVEAWQRSVELDPKQYDALFNLGLVAAQQGRGAEARKALRQFVETAPPQRFAADIRKAQGILREIGG
ncbi:MAG TPA: tetratricopeptide repeat protein [Thermoanaerobaculia bacterium]|nr:tetratricopeptide repeat protein [Thermoanaerobaculia bacterium]